MKDKLLMGFFKARAKCIAAMHNEKGETNIIAIILIVIIVIALAAVFRNRITQVVNNLFNKVDKDVEGFKGEAAAGGLLFNFFLL